MFTIKQAAQRVGVSEAVLRAWERRYDVVSPQRTDSGYRLYDDRTIAVLSSMRRLVDEGWSPAAAAKHVAVAPEASPDDVPAERRAVTSGHRAASGLGRTATGALPHEEATELTEAFLEAAAVVDPGTVETVLDQAFALGSFEAVAQSWLMPTLTALGKAWAEGWVDVAGEHAAAHAVMRRLSLAFAAAASATRGPRVVVALPPGSLHELGALTFATVARRRGLPVVYLGADLPVQSWARAVHAFPTRAAVLVVPTETDRAAACDAVTALQQAAPGLTVAAGGGASADLAPGVLALPHAMVEAVDLLESLSA